MYLLLMICGDCILDLPYDLQCTVCLTCLMICGVHVLYAWPALWSAVYCIPDSLPIPQLHELLYLSNLLNIIDLQWIVTLLLFVTCCKCLTCCLCTPALKSDLLYASDLLYNDMPDLLYMMMDLAALSCLSLPSPAHWTLSGTRVWLS